MSENNTSFIQNESFSNIDISQFDFGNSMQQSTSYYINPIPKNIKFRNQNENVENLITEGNENLEDIIFLFNKSNEEIKQLNNKTVEQTYQLKELRADLNEEIDERKESENKLSQKDWKILLCSGIIALITGLIGAWFGVWLTT